MTEELYRSETLRLTVGLGDADRWVIAFDNYGHDFSLDREGFGQRYFRDRGISCVTVVGRGNDWYQYPDIEAAMAAVRTVTAGASRVMTYGSSMGGYAAIRLAARVGATGALALSPQFSNDPAVVPFEQRWRQEGRAIDWRSVTPLDCGCVPVIAYDPGDTDRLHVALIAAETPVTRIALPYAGHPVTTFISSVGLLDRLVAETLDGSLDAASFEAEARRRRKGDPVYCGELARRQPPWRHRTAIALARQGLARAPDTHILLHVLAKRLTDSGAADESLPLFERLMLLSGGYAGYAVPYADALLAANHHAHALRIAEGVIAANPHVAHLQGWLAHIRWRSGDQDGARRGIAVAINLDPADDQLRVARKRYTAMPSPEEGQSRPSLRRRVLARLRRVASGG